MLKIFLKYLLQQRGNDLVLVAFGVIHIG